MPSRTRRPSAPRPSASHDPAAAWLRALDGRRHVAALPVVRWAQALEARAQAQFDPTLRTAMLTLRDELAEVLHHAANEERWVSVEEAASDLDRPVSTIRYWARQALAGRRGYAHIGVEKVPGGRWRVDLDSLKGHQAA